MVPEKYNELSHILVRGAREHNLKNINVDIPRDQFVVITGLSGSGKSSLAFDTLYAEGQRRYVESLSPYARQFLGLMEKPDVDSIEGLSPAISIEQKTVGHNPRSTVGTVTEIYDYVRLLYSKIGIQHCINHPDTPVRNQSFDQILDSILRYDEGTRIQILAPIIRGRKGHYRELFEDILKQGFTKVRVNGKIQEITEGMQLDRYKLHNIEIVVDRISIHQDQLQRISESVELALKRGDGIVYILREKPDGNWEEIMFNLANACPICNASYETLAPNAFSFNSPYGCCSQCEGLGEIRDFNNNLLVPDKSVSIKNGGITIIGKERDIWIWNQVQSVATALNIPLNAPIEKVSTEHLVLLLRGGGKQTFPFEHIFKNGQKKIYQQRYTGIIPFFREQYIKTTSSHIRTNIESYMSAVECPGCKGGRLKPETLSVKIQEKSIGDAVAMSIVDALEFFISIKLTEREHKIAHLILKEIIGRLQFLLEVGLGYLTINRAARTLSGGEAQRIRLASQIASQLVGVMYVLDEPSIGLHQHDNRKLIGSLKKLRDLGNSVIVVEHDREMIEEADYLLDLGPRAGIHGGEVILASKKGELEKNPNFKQSLTAQYVLSQKNIPIPETRRTGNGKFLTLEGAKGNNLQDVCLNIPLETFTCITGMSGSGKSTLINDTLYPILSRHFFSSHSSPLEYGKITGLENIDKVIEIDQTPIGRTPRSNPATYTGVFTAIRDLFTQLPESKIRGYKPGRFSFNVALGSCKECEGDGVKKIEMNFLPDVYVTCDSCGGKRYDNETLQVRFKGKSISDILEMNVAEAAEFFRDVPKISRKMQTLNDVGLGYVKVGQQAPTLSGGEAQRVKLATELSKIGTGKTLYILDEPTTGLHFEDVRVLLDLLQKLVNKGNTVMVIEHNLDVIKVADWVVDLGPEGGKYGGKIIAEGTPEAVAESEGSFTGYYLKAELNHQKI